MNSDQLFDDLFMPGEETIKFEHAEDIDIFDELVAGIADANRAQFGGAMKEGALTMCSQTTAVTSRANGTKLKTWSSKGTCLSKSSKGCVSCKSGLSCSWKMVTQTSDHDTNCNNLWTESVPCNYTLDSQDCKDTDLEMEYYEKEIKRLLKLVSSKQRFRNDLFYKTLLRKCRKYYWQEFNDATGFSAHKRKKCNSYYFDCIKEYLSKSFKSSNGIDVSFYLGALIYPEIMVKWVEKFIYPDGVKNSTPNAIIKKKVQLYKAQVDKLQDVLYNFTIQKLELFASIPELASLFLNYVQNGTKNDTEALDNNSLVDLVKKWEKTLSSRKKCKGSPSLMCPTAKK